MNTLHAVNTRSVSPLLYTSPTTKNICYLKVFSLVEKKRKRLVCSLHIYVYVFVWGHTCPVHYCTNKTTMLLLLLCCLMSSDVSWHIRDKLRPVPKHGSILLYVHKNQKMERPGRPPRLSHSSWAMKKITVDEEKVMYALTQAHALFQTPYLKTSSAFISPFWTR